MIKRPISFGAVILVLILYISNYFGVSETVPRSLLKEGSTLQLMGRVKSREHSGYGTRLYLEECEILPTDFIYSKQLSEQNSFQIIATQSELSIKQKSILKQKKQVLVYLKKETGKIAVGNRVVVEGVCSFFEPAVNPGQFDSASYYNARGVGWMLKKSRILGQWQEGTYAGILDRIRTKLYDSMERVMGAENASMMAAITLGIREDMTDEMKRLYQEGGIAHVLAISSLHITIIGRSVYWILRKIRCSLAGSAFFSGIFLFSFCMMTGMSVSAKRACVMYLLWLGSQVFGRTQDLPTALGMAVLFVVIPSPEYMWDSSCLLSFGCILSIRYLQPMLQWLLPIPGMMGTSLQTSVAVQLGTLPMIMLFFYQVTPYGFLINLVVLPLMGILMVSCLAGAVIGFISLPAGVLAAAPCHYLLEGFEWLCRMERQLPGAVVITGTPQVWQIVVYYGMLCFAGLLFFCWKREGKMTAAVILAAAVAVLGVRFSPELRIVVLDVGQGDGILIQSGDFACMIDGGSSSESKVWQYRIESCLKYYGIKELDAVLISHGDQDHISGIAELLEGYEAGWQGRNIGGITLKRLIYPDVGYREENLQRLTVLAKEKGIPTGRLQAGGKIETGELKLTCLAPDRSVTTGDPNQDSMVLLLEYRDFKALFTGDLEKEGENLLLKETEAGRWKALLQGEQIDLLKVAHHGSRYGTTDSFLKQWPPELAIISCGRENSYGHPAGEVLERLNEAGAEIRRTDQEGAILLEYRDGTWKTIGFSRSFHS